MYTVQMHLKSLKCIYNFTNVANICILSVLPDWNRTFGSNAHMSLLVCGSIRRIRRPERQRIRQRAINYLLVNVFFILNTSQAVRHSPFLGLCVCVSMHLTCVRRLAVYIVANSQISTNKSTTM